MARGKGRNRPQGHPARRGQGVARPPAPQQQQVVTHETIAFEIEGYRGPVPPPALIDGYQAAIPNGGERVLALAEREAEHRHSMDRRQFRWSVVVHILGQLLAFALAAGVIAVGAWLIHDGKDIAGYATLLVGAASLIAAVIRGVRPGPQ